ncbi:bucentaur or craniofacial development-domain-containing protein [Triangularia verruculosa]|uniref:SWR1-complex protein 5 n=1 Tax=Triangularia verruculosa TaxID=2587418 RepID=A0AAN6XL56_9PEZI|nr:bucentaur or craniofacial development-domain-containing protein [Triangularia verruculosa]
MAPPELNPLEEEYVSEEDSDFAPEDDNAPAAEESSASGDEDENATAKPTAKRKRPAGDDAAEDAGFENSGDEAIISKGLKKKKRKQTKEDAEDEGGEGGLIKTRAQRAVEKAEKRAAVSSGPITIDVDALWAQMTSEAAAPQPPPPSQEEKQQEKEAEKPAEETVAEKDLIKIKRTYNFAGKVHTEEKLVHRDSAEAKLYLAEQAGKEDNNDSEEPARKLKKAFRSAFEPVMPIDPATGQRRSDLNLGVASRLKARELAAAKAKKLNTVEKSRMDWAGFVDKEGIKDELELAGKSKDSYAARQDFLARSEALREEEARRARMAGKV